MATYKALVGLTFPAGKKNLAKAAAGMTDVVTRWTRVEAGKVTSDIPTSSLPWLLEQGLIEPVDGSEPEAVSDDDSV
jgi:hypothetical protein